jgi:hypothetical protein
MQIHGFKESQVTRKIKIIGLYVLSAMMLTAYWLINNSVALRDFLEKTDRVMTHWAFGFYAIIGIVKFALLIAGIAIPITLTIMMIKNRKNEA